MTQKPMQLAAGIRQKFTHMQYTLVKFVNRRCAMGRQFGIIRLYRKLVRFAEIVQKQKKTSGSIIYFMNSFQFRDD